MQQSEQALLSQKKEFEDLNNQAEECLADKQKAYKEKHQLQAQYEKQIETLHGQLQALNDKVNELEEAKKLLENIVA